MKTIEIKVARIYIMEASGSLSAILSYLQKTANVRGVSVFRAISGFGETGKHSTSLLDLSLNLPLTIEFFDEPQKVEHALEYLSTIIKPEHIIFWTAYANA